MTITTQRIGGWSLLAAAATTVLAMAHHPTDLRAPGLVRFVHGVMIATVLVNAFGFASFATERGIRRAPILAGAIGFAVAVVANIGAATINGFVAPAVAGRVGPDTLRLAFAANRAFADVGVMAMGASYLFWSGDLLRGPDGRTRLTGLAGLVAGGLPPLLLATGALRLNVAGAFGIYALQAGWGALIGLELLRRSASGR